MGIFLGLLSAVFFAASALLIRAGMKNSPREDGLYMTIVVNVLMLGIVGLFVSKPEWSTRGIVTLAAAGLIGTLAGRHTSFRALRMIGATRASVFVTGAPAASALTGWLILDEAVGLVDALGGALVIAGLIYLARGRSTIAPVPGAEAPEHPPIVGYAYAIATPLIFGLAFVVRKWGLQFFDSAVLGALIGATAALAFLFIKDVIRGDVRSRRIQNFQGANWWFVGGGISISMALITQFSAFSFAPAWVVGALQGTQALLVVLFGYIFLRAEEKIDARVVVSMITVGAGVALITVAI